MRGKSRRPPPSQGGTADQRHRNLTQTSEKPGPKGPTGGDAGVVMRAVLRVEVVGHPVGMGDQLLSGGHRPRGNPRPRAGVPA